jgi:hypothetical protein
MFESAEIGHTLSKTEFNQRVPLIRQELLNLQQELREKKIISGDYFNWGG